MIIRNFESWNARLSGTVKEGQLYFDIRKVEKFSQTFQIPTPRSAGISWKIIRKKISNKEETFLKDTVCLNSGRKLMGVFTRDLIGFGQGSRKLRRSRIGFI